MPVLAVALPSLQFGFNSVTFARRMALYFVVPLGLTANAVGYSNHRNLAVTSTSLLGVSCVTAAATVKRLAPRRNWLNAFGCVLMLASSYKGRQLEREQAAQVSHSDACSRTHLRPERVAAVHLVELDDGILGTVRIEDLLGLNAEGSGGEGEHDGRLANVRVKLGLHGRLVVVARLQLRQALFELGRRAVLEGLLQ